MNELPWITNARKYIGTKEIKGQKHNPVIIALWKLAYKSKGLTMPSVFNNDETAWCGGFVADVMAESDLSHHIPKSFPMARSWLKAGTKLDKPAYGSVAVFWRGSPKGASGHVGFVVGRNKGGKLMILGGNQSDEVNIMPFDNARLLGCRWLGTQPYPNANRYNLPILRSDGRVSTNEA